MVLKHPYLGEIQVKDQEQKHPYILFSESSSDWIKLCRELSHEEREHWSNINSINFQLISSPLLSHGKFKGIPYGPDILKLFADDGKDTGRQFVLLNDEAPITEKAYAEILLNRLAVAKSPPQAAGEMCTKWWEELLLRDILVDLG